MTIPAWLQRHLEATGQANPDGIARQVRTRACRRCGQTILAGLDADRGALAAEADPTPIDTLGEALALATGRATYDAVTAGGRLELDRRGQARVEAPRKYPVLAEHRCGVPLPADHDPPTPRRHPEPIQPPAPPPY